MLYMCVVCVCVCVIIIIIIGLTVLLPEETESVLLGSAILAKAAADNTQVRYTCTCTSRWYKTC